MSEVWGCRWSIPMGNVTKVSHKCFQWVKNASPFNEDFIKNYNEDSDAGYFLDIFLNIFAWKNENWKSWKSCSQLAQ